MVLPFAPSQANSNRRKISTLEASPDESPLKLTRTAIRKMKVLELREELTKLGLDNNGIREVLLQRFMDAVFAHDSDGVKARTKMKNVSAVPEFSPTRLYVMRFRSHMDSIHDTPGVGLVIFDVATESEVWSGRKYFAEIRSRFDAEYRTIIIGLKMAYANGIRRLVLQGDNHVILKQLEGSFNVTKDDLRKLYWTTIDLKEKFDVFEVQPINTTQNGRAKLLASRAVATKRSEGLDDYDDWASDPSLDSIVEPVVSLSPPSAPLELTTEQTSASSEKEKRDSPLVDVPAVEVNTTSQSVEPISNNKRYLLRFDGGSRGNPGIAGAGMVIYDDMKQEVWCGWKFLEYTATNNDAEYTALVVGLKCALSLGITNLRVEGDSELIVRQLEGRYKVKTSRLMALYRDCKDLISKFEKIEVRHIPRAQNARADQLANVAMDSQESFGFEDVAQ